MAEWLSPKVGGAGGQDDLVGVNLPSSYGDHDVTQLVMLPDHVQLRQGGPRMFVRSRKYKNLLNDYVWEHNS